MELDLEFMENSDSGGVGAKKGFLYQDYAAVLYVVYMLLDKEIKGVRCEVTDDIDIIYNDYIEYIQVKTTDSDNKWTIKEFCEVSPPKKNKDNKMIIYTDSIIHKSLDCDKIRGQKAKFRILSTRDVNSSLNYLKIPFYSRPQKEGRDALHKSLYSKIKKYVSPNGNDIAYWIDNALWEVKSSKDVLIYEARDIISKAAIALGVNLEGNREVNIILHDILVTVTDKSAISRKINVAADKTYFREDLITWFENELEIIAKQRKNHTKVYTRDKTELKQILLELMPLSDISDNRKNGLGLKQGYYLKKYRYAYISKTLVDWLPELLLRPNELADTYGIKFMEQWKNLTTRLEQDMKEFEQFIGRLLHHSTIRYYLKSQPILASLYIDDTESFREFENIHIVKKAHSPDEIWMGFSKLTNESNIEETIDEICKELDFLLTNYFDKQREKILNVKEDNFLLNHDTNEMLSASHSLDDYIDRFVFTIFIGYNSTHLEINNSKNTMDINYEDNLKQEVEEYFNLQIDKLSKTNDYFEELRFNIYLYPTPCIKELLNSIKEEFEGVLKNG